MTASVGHQAHLEQHVPMVRVKESVQQQSRVTVATDDLFSMQVAAVVQLVRPSKQTELVQLRYQYKQLNRSKNNQPYCKMVCLISRMFQEKVMVQGC